MRILPVAMFLRAVEDVDHISLISDEELFFKVFLFNICIFLLRCRMVSMPRPSSFFLILVDSVIQAEMGISSQSRKYLVHKVSRFVDIQVAGKLYNLRSKSNCPWMYRTSILIFDCGFICSLEVVERS